MRMRHIAICGLTYVLTPWCRVLLKKLTVLQLVKKFPAFHGTRRFITALTSVRHFSLSWASPVQSIYPHPTSWRSILILSTLPYLSIPKVDVSTTLVPLSPFPAHYRNRNIGSWYSVYLPFRKISTILTNKRTKYLSTVISCNSNMFRWPCVFISELFVCYSYSQLLVIVTHVDVSHYGAKILKYRKTQEADTLPNLIFS